jgi:hypothetical protein
VAISPAHKFGQMIGELLESTVAPILSDFAKQYGLYLDKKGPRPARKGRKVTWTDQNSNKHDLDFVLERGATHTKIGTPVAFIETAWRRYTKHSRNKAQEIQGAVLPLCETYRHYRPFTGAVLAGIFTEGALSQLKSLGFSVAYFPYETVLQAFSTVGIDARSDETTADEDFKKKLKLWDELENYQKARVGKELADINADAVKTFIEALRTVAMRTIQSVRILPLHGHLFESQNVEEAIGFMAAYKEQGVWVVSTKLCKPAPTISLLMKP